MYSKQIEPGQGTFDSKDGGSRVRRTKPALAGRLLAPWVGAPESGQPGRRRSVAGHGSATPAEDKALLEGSTMIAIRHEFPDRRMREETYSLRRILMRRLQEETRGISRRERIQRQRQFVSEWRNMMLQKRSAALQGVPPQALLQDYDLLSRLHADRAAEAGSTGAELRQPELTPLAGTHWKTLSARQPDPEPRSLALALQAELLEPELVAHSP